MGLLKIIRAEVERRIAKYRNDGFGTHANSLERFRDEFLNNLKEDVPGFDYWYENTGSQTYTIYKNTGLLYEDEFQNVLREAYELGVKNGRNE